MGGFFALALLALAVRLPQLGIRPMHTDESVNAYIIGQLLAGEKFHYDPQDRHGPALAALALPLAKLQGAKSFSDLTESELRLAPVLVGTATVLLFGAAVELFGFIACVIAAALFAFTPLAVYYNRYFIHESFFVAATLGLILSGWRTLKFNSTFSAALAGFSAAFMLACKETAPLHFFALALAGFACWIFRSHKKPAADFPPLKIILTAFAIFLFTAILLFTWFGQNWRVSADLFHAIPNFAARAGGQGHEKPFFYYAKLLCGGWSGATILMVAMIGFFRAARSLASGARFAIAIYALAIFLIYSAIPYKTPWLALNFWLPLAILAGIAVEWMWLALPKFSARAVILISIIAIGFLIFHDTNARVFKNPADEKNPYAYAHTSEDLLGLPSRLEELAQQNKISSPRIAVIAADPWPLPWYLRNFLQVGFWQPDQKVGAADFFITSTDASEKMNDQLKNFRPDFFGVRPGVLIILWSPTSTNAP